MDGPQSWPYLPEPTRLGDVPWLSNRTPTCCSTS